MKKEIKKFTDAELIAELRRRHYRTDLIIGIPEIEMALGDDEGKLTKKQMVAILDDLNMESQEIYDQIMDHLAPVIFGQ